MSGKRSRTVADRPWRFQAGSAGLDPAAATAARRAWIAPTQSRRPSRIRVAATTAVTATHLAGEPITERLTAAPGNGAPIGGLKVVTAHGWFAARPSGTEDVTKLYAESFVDAAHLERIIEEAQAILLAAVEA